MNSEMADYVDSVCSFASTCNAPIVSSNWEFDESRDIMQELRDTMKKMESIPPLKKQACVLSEEQFEALKAAMPQSNDTSVDILGIEVHHAKTPEERRQIALMLRFRGYEVTVIDHADSMAYLTQRVMPPCEPSWPDMMFDTLNYACSRLGVPSHVINASESGNYSEAKAYRDRMSP